MYVFAYIYIKKTFPTCRGILTSLQQQTHKNSAAKGEIAHDEQYFSLPNNIFKSILHYILSFLGLQYFCRVDFQKSFATELLHVGKG